MGGSSSRSQTQGQTGEINQSGGFHVLEIHAPTVGGTLVMIVLLLLVAAAFFWCIRKMQRNSQAAALRYAHNSMAPHQLQQQPPTGWLPRIRNSLALPPSYKIPEGV